MDRECEIGEGVVGPAHSADSLVMEAYPPHIRPHQVEYLKTLFRDVPDRGPERLASQLLRCLNMPSYSVSEEEIQEFLFHISIHGHNDDSKERARIAYALFMDYLDSPATKKQKIAAASGYKWTGTELDHFNVVFDLGYEIGHIIDQQPLSGTSLSLQRSNEVSELIVHCLSRSMCCLLGQSCLCFADFHGT